MTRKGFIAKGYEQLIQLNKKMKAQSKYGQKIQTCLYRRHLGDQKKQNKTKQQQQKKQVKRCSISLNIRQMQIKTAMKYHLAAVRMAIIKKSEQ